jgi:hypothetical protein
MAVAESPATAAARAAARHSAAAADGPAVAPPDPVEELRHAVDLVVVPSVGEGQQLTLELRQPVGCYKPGGGIVPVCSNGETEDYSLILSLNELGRGFLVVDEHLEANSELEGRTFTLE